MIHGRKTVRAAQLNVADVQGGVPTKRLDALRREFLLSYGHEQSLLLAALQRAALLLRQVANRAPWPALKAKFNLIVDNISESNPQDLAYTFSGYAPLSCRLVEAAVSGGWGTCREGLALLPGDTVDYTQVRNNLQRATYVDEVSPAKCLGTFVCWHAHCCQRCVCCVGQCTVHTTALITGGRSFSTSDRPHLPHYR